MKLKMKTMTAILGPMTAAERMRGRYMRSPDGHGDGGAAGGGGGSASDAGSSGGDGNDGGAQNTQSDDNNAQYGDASGEDGVGDDSEGEDLGTHYTGDDDGSDGEGSDNDGGDEGDASGDGQGDEGQSQNRSEQRIKEHEAARREAERKAAEATREAEKWRRIAEAAPPAPQVPEGQADPNAEPDPANFEFGAADPEYIAAKAEWKAISRLRQEGEQARITAELNGLEAKYQSAIPAALEKYPDYDEVVTKGAEGEAPKWVCSLIMALGIRDSEVGTDIAYHLAKNPEESRRVSNLSDFEQAREFGRLEGRFLYEKEQSAKSAGNGNGAGAGNGAPTQQRQRSAAPPPPKKNLARGAGGKFTVPPDTDDFAAFDRAYGN